MRLFILTLLILFYQSVVLACDFKIINFGDPQDKIKINPAPITFPDRFGGENIAIPMEDLCKNDKSLYGTLANFLFIDKKLIQISLMRPNLNDAKLMDFAMKEYGSFPLPSGVKKKDWRGNYIWEKGNENINYIYTNIHDGSAEIIEYTSKLYLNDLTSYNEKIGEWLDSQK